MAFESAKADLKIAHDLCTNVERPHTKFCNYSVEIDYSYSGLQQPRRSDLRSSSPPFLRGKHFIKLMVCYKIGFLASRGGLWRALNKKMTCLL